MKRLTLTLLSFVALAMAACQSDNPGGGGHQGQALCPVGQLMTQGGCTANVYGQNNPGPVAYYTEANNPWSNSGNTLTMSSGYQTFLRDGMGVCDRCANSSGQASCSSWMSGFNDIVIQMPDGTAQNATVTFRSSPKYDNFNYYFSFPSLGDFFSSFIGIAPGSCSAAYYAPRMPLTMTVNSLEQGFVLSGSLPQGMKWYGYTIRIWVDHGKLGDNFFDYKVLAIDKSGNTSTIATGRFNRCQSQSCGL